MTMDQLFILITQGTILLTAFLSALDWAMHRHQTRLDVMLMFGALAVIVVIQWLTQIGAGAPWLVLLSQLMLLAQPYLLLRMIPHFQTLPRWIEVIALGGLIAASLATIALPPPLPLGLILGMVGWWFVVEAYAALAFLRGALSTGGVIRGRLGLAALGSFFLAVWIMLSGAQTIFPSTVPSLALAAELLGMVAVLCYYFGFATPHWLRQFWQLSELHLFLRKVTGRRIDASMPEMLALFCHAAAHSTSSIDALAAEWQADTGRFVIRGSTDPAKLTGAITASGPAISTAWRERTTQLAHAPADFGPDELRLARALGASAIIIAPIATTDYAWGLLLVFSRRVPLFRSDDEAMLGLLAEQMATALGYANLLAEQGEFITQLRQRTAELGDANRDLRVMANERQRAEQALRTSEEELRALLASLTDQIFVLDRQGRFVNIAPTSPRQKLIGLDLLNKTVADLFPRDQAMTILSYVGLALDTRETVKVEYRMESGTWFSVSISTLRENEVVWVARDITERKHAEEALRHYTQRLQAVNDIDRAILAARLPEDIARIALARVRQLVPCQRAAILLFDNAQNRAVFLAVDAPREFAGPAAQAGVPLENLLPPEPIRRDPMPWYVADIRTETNLPRFFREMSKEGFASVIITPLFVEGHLIGQMILLANRPAAFAQEHQDIAHEVANQLAVTLQQARLRQELARHAEELEQRVAERTEQLQASNKELEAFSYSVSHDLRTPLSALTTFVDMMKEDYGPQLDPTAQGYLRLIRDNATQMGQLIEDLLAFSRSSRLPVQKERVRTTELVKQVVETLTADLRDRKLEISIDDLPDCNADPGLLRQVWVNLISNALKFTRRREITQIAIGYCQRDGKYIYFVKDNGVGFDMRSAEKLFGVFQRFHHAEDYEGTGVGLAIVQRIVRRHGGDIWAESIVNQGTTFSFTLE